MHSSSVHCLYETNKLVGVPIPHGIHSIINGEYTYSISRYCLELNKVIDAIYDLLWYQNQRFNLASVYEIHTLNWALIYD